MGITALERARKLEAEAKELRRQEKRFWEGIEARRDEVAEHLGVGQTHTDLMDAAAQLYGISAGELYEYVTAEQQLELYFRQHGGKGADEWET